MARKQVQIRDLEANARYYVQLRAVDDQNNTSAWSSRLVVDTIVDTMPPAPVTGLAVSRSGTSYKVSFVRPITNANGTPLNDLRDIQIRFWDPANPSEHYTVHTNDSEAILSLDANRALFGTAKAKLTFEVTARDRVGNVSEPRTATAEFPLPTPVHLVSDSRRLAIELNWSEPVDNFIDRIDIHKNSAKYASVGADSTSYTDVDPGFGPQYYMVRLIDVFGRGADSNTVMDSDIELDFESDTVPPKPPTNLQYSDEAAANGMSVLANLSWAAPTQDIDDTDYSDQEGFEVRFRTDPTRSWSYRQTPDTRPDGSVPGNFDMDIQLAPGGTLYWGVRAFDKSRNYSTWATAQNTIAVDTVPPAPPTGVVAEGGVGTIYVSWSPNTEPDLEYYEVEAAGNAQFTGASVVYRGSATHASFLASSQRWVRVYAYDRAGNKSDPSTSDNATPVAVEFEFDETPPSNVTGLTGNLSIYKHGGVERGKLTLTWSPATDNVGVTGYIVRKRQGTGAWEEYVTGGSATSYSLYDLVPGATYEFQVKAVDAAGNISVNWSSAYSVTITTEAPTAPSQVTWPATGAVEALGVGSIKFNWNPVSNVEIRDYEVTTATNSGFTANVRTHYIDGTALTITGTPGTTYWARVRARSIYGVVSATWSASQSATAKKLVTDDVQTIDLGASVFTGQLAANRIIVGSGTTFGTGYDPTTKETPDGAQAKADAARDAAILHGESYADDSSALAAQAINEAIRGDFTGTATGTLIDGAYIQTGTIDAELLKTNIAITNGLRVQSLFQINAGGTIESTNFNATTKTGFRLTDTSMQMYQGSIILGGSGLNINTETNQMWFGADTFANAAWRVDSTGAMRAGTVDTALNILATGELRIGANTTTAPIRFTPAGLAEFRNIRINTLSLGTPTVDTNIINVGDKFLVRRLANTTTDEVRLAGNMFIDAGGNLTLGGGAITLTSGNFTMNGGTMAMAGGTMNLSGTTLNLTASNFNITSTSGSNGNIILNGGNAGTGTTSHSGVIKSNDYNYSTKQGWALGQDGLFLFSGEINASLISIQQNPNLLDHGYSIFSYDQEWYDVFITRSSTASFTATVTTVWSRYGQQALRLVNTSGVARYAYLAETISTYNIPVDAGATYIMSAYVHNNGAASTDIRLAWRRDTGTDSVFGPTETLAPGESRRIWASVTAVAGQVSALAALYMAGNGDIIIDGIQFEERVGSNTEPSFFKSGGVTTISGGRIRTGSIRSSATIGGLPNWELNMSGDLIARTGTFAGALSAATGSFAGDISAATGTFSGLISGGSILIGSGNNRFGVDAAGNMWVGSPVFSGTGTVNAALRVNNTGQTWIGHTTFTSAPFRVTAAGAVTATNLSLSGSVIGNLTISGGTLIAAGGRFQVTGEAVNLYDDPLGAADSGFRWLSSGTFPVIRSSISGDAFLGSLFLWSASFLDLDAPTTYVRGILETTTQNGSGLIHVSNTNWKNHFRATRGTGNYADFTCGSGIRGELHHNNVLVVSFSNTNTTISSMTVDLPTDTRIGGRSAVPADGARRHRSTDWTLTQNSWVAMSWNVASWTATGYSSLTSGISPPREGWYHVTGTASVNYTTGQPGTRWALRVMVNGVASLTHHPRQDFYPTLGGWPAQVSGTIYLLASDRVNLEVYATGVSPRAGAGSDLEIVYLGSW